MLVEQSRTRRTRAGVNLSGKLPHLIELKPALSDTITQQALSDAGATKNSRTKHADSSDVHGAAWFLET